MKALQMRETIGYSHNLGMQKKKNTLDKEKGHLLASVSLTVLEFYRNFRDRLRYTIQAGTFDTAEISR